MNDEVYFTMETVGRGCKVLVLKSYTHQNVWNAEKCWFAPGQKVLITDENGKAKVFVKE